MYSGIWGTCRQTLLLKEAMCGVWEGLKDLLTKLLKLWYRAEDFMSGCTGDHRSKKPTGVKSRAIKVSMRTCSVSGVFLKSPVCSRVSPMNASMLAGLFFKVCEKLLAGVAAGF